MSAPTSHYMLGMRVDYLRPSAAIANIIERARSGRGGYCVVPDASQCVLAHDSEEHREIVNSADLVVSDSTILEWSRAVLRGVEMRKPMRGAEMMLELCRVAESSDVSIGLLGGRDDDVTAALKVALLRLFPKLKIPFAYAPPFRPLTLVEDIAVTRLVNASGTKLLFVGLGCPKQEQFMAAHRDTISAMMIGLGAAFDYNSGVVGPPAAWVHRAGLEWLYRLAREPKRLWRRYLLTAPRFIVLAAVDAVRGKPVTLGQP